MPRTIVCLGIAWLFAMFPVTASAQATQPTQSAQRQMPVAAVAATGLMEQGENERAKAILLEARERFAESDDIAFLLGMLAMGEQDYEGAAEYFREILIRDPQAVRVRLELGRALFESGDYRDAGRQFRFARSGDLPAEVNANIDRYLAAIRERQTFDWDVSVAMAPDTNVNAAPSIEEISIFGLPFELSEGARRQTGVGLLLNTSAEWSPHIGERTRLRVGGDVYRTDYSGGDFDDTLARVHLGPNWRFDNTELSTLLTGFHRWYGNEPYNHGAGIRQELTHYPSSRTRLHTSLEHQWVRHDEAESLDGTRTSWLGSWQYALTPSSGVMGLVGVSRESTELDMLSNNVYRAGVGYYRELFGGLTALVQPEYLHARYDDVTPAFGVERRDDLWRTRLRLTNRRWIFKGFTPELTLIHSSRRSNIDLYSYDRNQIQLGVTRLY
ncbi:porin family protein [Halomonas urumqiensis]|uniref:porin family protein n=1 Tax=Halomonas urumqiensis TaxID=1684789 RepID=UPI0011B23D17|nr:porin family protein [Halomonas urumqiensis]